MTEDYAARVADDDDPLRGMLRAARAWGRPPSVFMGRAVVTTYQNDRAGRLVRSETHEWTWQDREMALALQDYEARLCRGCGGDLTETTKPENQHRYKGEMAYVCHRCVALEVASDVKHPHPNALTFTAELREET